MARSRQSRRRASASPQRVTTSTHPAPRSGLYAGLPMAIQVRRDAETEALARSHQMREPRVAALQALSVEVSSRGSACVIATSRDPTCSVHETGAPQLRPQCSASAGCARIGPPANLDGEG